MITQINKSTPRTIRETSATWESNGDDGKILSSIVTVGYFSPTIGQLKEQRLAAKKRFEDDPTDIVWLSEELLPMLHSLTGVPVVVPSPITLEWLDEQDLRNLTAVRDAINEDISLGKSKSAR